MFPGLILPPESPSPDLSWGLDLSPVDCAHKTTKGIAWKASRSDPKLPQLTPFDAKELWYSLLSMEDRASHSISKAKLSRAISFCHFYLGSLSLGHGPYLMIIGDGQNLD
ncbi:hypothetical protein ATANTOWER_014607 [Ataeniobius toweri]|uniref:Uncharacterized protein n=1 Tax=Ataeniobius toweri TaxID=208326 RepID=A0ABU7AG00_9TELE|nr:hypothetical protein [Ataeniobius toweri]